MNKLYSLPNVGMCAVIKKMLDEKGIEYECIEDEMEMMLNGYEAVPVLETDECVYTRPVEIKKWIMEQR